MKALGALAMAALLAAPGTVNVTEHEQQSGDVNLAEWSLEKLVAELHVEHSADEDAAIEAVSFHVYDRVVGEILRRRSIAAIPLLLERINDDSVVVLRAHGLQPRLCWYDAPVRTKHKVRFILERLLDPEDYYAVVGDPLVPNIDVEAARRAFDQRRDHIQRRMQDE